MIKALSSFSRKISYVFIFCGLLLCYLVVSMRQASIETVYTENGPQPRAQVQVPNVLKQPIKTPSLDTPPPRDNVRPIQDLLMQQARDKTRSLQQIQTETAYTEEPDVVEEPDIVDEPEGIVETNGDLHVLKGSGKAGVLFKDFRCGKNNSKLQWCTVDEPEDLLQIKLPPFLKDYKNPCWRVEQADVGPPPIRCLPHFFLAGAPKSGTTDLFSRLVQHPQISELVKKELHWFSRRRYAPRENKGLPQHPMFSNYTDMFVAADTDLYESVDKSGYHVKIFGDSSVSTLWDNMNAVRFSIMTDRSVPGTAECIHHLNPATKFVSIIRNPTERTYSDYLYFGNEKKSKEAFHDAVKSAVQTHRLCVKHYSLEDCINYRASNQSRARLNVAIYVHHFEEFFQYFPKDQFVILKLEDYSASMADNLAKVFHFLGLDPMSDKQMVHVSNQTTIFNTRPSSGTRLGDMWPETRQLLDDFFRPYNERLGKLIGDYYNYNRK